MILHNLVCSAFSTGLIKLTGWVQMVLKKLHRSIWTGWKIIINTARKNGINVW